MIKLTYSGIGSLKEIKDLRKRLKEIEATLEGRGCRKIELYINYYYAMGFFTSPSGSVYYISLPDVRFNKLNQDILIRSAMNYKDYQGGINRYCKPTKEALLNFFIS
jgi:hypothetical protein